MSKNLSPYHMNPQQSPMLLTPGDIDYRNVPMIGNGIYGYSETGKDAWKNKFSQLLGCTSRNMAHWRTGKHEMSVARKVQIARFYALCYPSAFAVDEEAVRQALRETENRQKMGR